MKSFLKTVVAASGIILAGANSVFAVTAVKPLEGYKCMRVKIPEEKRWDPLAVPPVFAAPTEESRQVGRAASVVLVKVPVNEVNGFIEILRVGAKAPPVWISAKVLSPWQSNTVPPQRCVPSIMSNGMIGTGN
jgi:hypothetical protein